MTVIASGSSADSTLASDVMWRLVVLAVIATLAFLGVPAEAEASAAVAEQVVTTPSEDTTTPSPLTGDDRPIVTSSSGTATPAPTVPEEGVDEEATATPGPVSTGEGVDLLPEEGADPEFTATATPAATGAPPGPGELPRFRDSRIPFGSIALALLVLASVGVGLYLLSRRRATTTATAQPSGPADAVADGSARGRIGDSSMSDFLIGLGEALMDAGAAVGHVESALRSVAEANGTGGVGVMVLPTAIVVSVPDGEDLLTEIGAPGRAPLRLDQIDDVLKLVHEAEVGAIGARAGARRLAEIRSAAHPYSSRKIVVGHICATVGLAAILHATWVEIVVATLLGAAVGAFRLWSRRLSSSYQSFVVLVAATGVSTSVFALTRVMDDLLTFPLLISPLITFLPGGLLTIAVLELVTGQIVSGASRLASGGVQLILLALGLVAGGQLVGVPARELGSNTGAAVTAITPWLGIAVFGIGLVWFYGARPSARVWILLVMYIAYAGQVVGGLFFGSSLSAFFGALAMTPIAVLIARSPTAPSPLVTILPGFWLLVPGALGLDGVTRLFGAGGVAATGVLVTTATSMVGVSLGILLGLLLVASDPERPWSETRMSSQPHLEQDS